MLWHARTPRCFWQRGVFLLFDKERHSFCDLIRFGDDLLSHVLRRSTIGAKALNGWVRDGTRCFALAMITKPKEASRLHFCVAESNEREAAHIWVHAPAPSPFRVRTVPKSCTSNVLCMLLIVISSMRDVSATLRG